MDSAAEALGYLKKALAIQQEFNGIVVKELKLLAVPEDGWRELNVLSGRLNGLTMEIDDRITVP